MGAPSPVAGRSILTFEDSDDKELSEGEEATIEKFISQYGGDVSRISVYWLDPETGRPYHLKHFAPDALNEDIIRKKFKTLLKSNGGQGTFYLRLLNSEGVYMKQKGIHIMDPELMDDPGTLAVVPPQNNQLDKMMTLQMATMQEAAQRNHEMMLAMITNMSKGNGGSSGADFVQAVVALKGATDSPENKFMGPLLESVIKRAFEPGDKSGSPDNMYSVIKDVASAVLSGGLKLPTLTGTPPPVTAGPQVVTIPTPQLPTAQLPVDPTDPVKNVIPVDPADPVKNVTPVDPVDPASEIMNPAQALMELKKQIAYLKDRCRKGKDVSLFVDSILENDDEPGNAVLLQAVMQYPFEELYVLDPDIKTDASLNQWFRTLFTELHTVLTQERDGEQNVNSTKPEAPINELQNKLDTSGGNGNTANSSGNRPDDSAINPTSGDTGKSTPDSQPITGSEPVKVSDPV